MTVAELPTRPRPRGPSNVARRQHIVLTGISWETYRRLREECDPLHLKMTFDRGALEIMPPRADHAMVTRFVDLLITATCDELKLPLEGFRDTTWQRQALDRGLEADDCYYIQHAAIAAARGRNIDINRDPPPDLAVETDITHSTVDKEAVYAALGVPELWRWDDGVFRLRLLGHDGRYADASRSAALPVLPPDVIQRYVERRLREGESPAKRAFQAWLRGLRRARKRKK